MVCPEHCSAQDTVIRPEKRIYIISFLGGFLGLTIGSTFWFIAVYQNTFLQANLSEE